MTGWKPDDRIGNYRVAAVLKAGGMATLFVAQRLGVAGFARPVALKVIHPHLAQDPRFVRMFVDEAKLSAQIDHPNVVHVEELGRHDGTWFLAMELVHGASLSQLMRALGRRGRRPSPELAVAIAMQVADGLEAAHQTRDAHGELLGVVHRDVSPQNVLVAFKGHVKLIDFGIAMARGRTEHSSAGTIRGKFRYMSPEQANARAVDHRTDVYALGVVLWEMLAGRARFGGASDVEVLDAARAPVAVAPSEFAPGLAPALDAVVLDAMAPDPARRIATAAEFRRRLGEALPGARAVGPAEISALVVGALSEQVERARTMLLTCAPALASEELPTRTVASGVRFAATDDALDDALATFTIAGGTIDQDEAVSSEAPAPSAAVFVRADATRRRRGFAVATLTALLLCAGVTLAISAPSRARNHAAPSPPRAIRAPAVAPVVAIAPIAPAPVVASVPMAAAVAPVRGHTHARAHGAAPRMQPNVQRFGEGNQAVPVATDLGP